MEGAGVRGSRLRAPLIGLLIVAGANLVAALYPFRLDPPEWRPNEVERLDHGVVTFGGHNVLRSGSTPPWLARVIETSRIRVELEARPTAPDQIGPARILSIAQSPYRADLVIGQSHDDLLVRMRRPGSKPTGSPGLIVSDALSGADWRSFVIELEPDGIEVRLDDGRAFALTLPAESTRTWDAESRVALGDEPVGGQPWRGALRRAEVVVDGRTYDLLVPGALEEPAGSWLLPDRLHRPAGLERTEQLSALAHLLAFVPLGYLLVRTRPERIDVLRALLLTAAFAALLTALKLVVAERHPAAIDVVFHAAGGGLGAWLARRGARHGRRVEEAP